MDANRRLAPLNNEKGISLVFVALSIFVLVGFLGLAVDMGHMQVVRGELQNSADAVALAGAGGLYLQAPGALPVLDWNQAQTHATLFVDKNKSTDTRLGAHGNSLSSADIVYGYWNVAGRRWESGSPVTAGTPPVPSTPPIVTAVGATVARSGSSNGGDVRTFFMQALGIDKTPVNSKQAVATSGFPGSVSPGGLFPMALSSCMTNAIFSLPPASWPNPVYINSPYGGPGSTCYTGQWTSFKLDSNDVPTIRDLITNGNPDPLQTGEQIWVEPGAKATLYNTNSWSPAFPAGGEDVLMAIVDSRGTDLNTKGEYTITGFARFHIDGGNQATQQIWGHFLAYYPDFPPGTAPGGPASNVVTPPVLAQ